MIAQKKHCGIPGILLNVQPDEASSAFDKKPEAVVSDGETVEPGAEGVDVELTDEEERRGARPGVGSSSGGGGRCARKKLSSVDVNSK